MKKVTKNPLKIVAILLIVNGLLNIFDNGMVLTYDITSILSGIGFILVSPSLDKR